MPVSTLTWGKTVTIVHRTVVGQDERGNDTYSEVNEDVPFCAVSPGSGSEEIQGTEQIANDVTVMLPDGASLTALDAMIIEGKTYELDRDPNQWQSPFSGLRSYVEAHGRRVTGASA